MYIIGTAGHVDHGKSTLVQTLTHIDPDRLAEEKRRQLTIDLGFAWFKLQDEMVGIVDVPGHRDFIENMLAGVGGIDAAMLVIAADEGVMPQTREHLAILHLLGIKRGVVALTKIDMVDSDEWLELVQSDIRDTLAETVLADAVIVPVSARTGKGIPSLLHELSQLIASLPEQPDYHRPKLPIDRVFSIRGFGTVVTGTLTGGTLMIGDEIALQPTGRTGRIRGLQSYEQPVEIAYPGSRVAVNIASIERDEIDRGDVLAYPGTIQATQLIDVQFHHLPDAPRPLKHNSEVKIFIGAAQALANTRLLDSETLAPGESGWLQLRLQTPLACARGDRFIVRYPSPQETIGGGVIINTNPGQRYKRFRPEVIGMLERQIGGTPTEQVIQAAQSSEPVTITHIQSTTGLDDSTLAQAIDDAVRTGSLYPMGEKHYVSANTYMTHINRMRNIIQNYHTQYPLQLGIPRAELRRRLQIKQGTFDWLITTQPDLISEKNGALIRLENHRVQFTPEQEKLAYNLLDALNKSPYTPPGYSEAVALVGNDEIIRALIDAGEIVAVQTDVIFSHQAYDAMITSILSMLDSGNEVSVKTVRDTFDTSRKYALALLEHLDTIGITRRVGDARVRGPKART